jgi:fatty-acyl-CoA synthase
MFETVQQLLRSRMADDTVAMKHGDRTWTWREHLAEAAAEASALIALADPSRPMHIGALLGNSPAMLRSMAAAALGGYVLCGINTTRRGDSLAGTSGDRIANSCSPTATTCLCSTGWIWAVRR